MAAALRSSLVPVARLDPATRAAMWALFTRYYEGVAPETFHRDLEAKRKVILVRDRAGAVQGFSTLTWTLGRHGGRRYLAVFSGDTVVAREHWGDGTLQRAFLAASLRLALRHPHRRVYWFLISKGYKTYLLLTRHVPEHWPRHDRPTPEWQASLLGHLAQARFGADWDPARGVVRLPKGGHLKPGVAPAEHLRTDPDVAFFLRANPGHADGDELACLGRLTPWLPVRYALRKRRR